MANFALGLQAGTDSGSRMVRAYNDAQENTRREAEHGYKMKDAARNEKIAQNQFDAALEYQEAMSNPEQYMSKLYAQDWGDLGKGDHAGKQLRVEKDKDGTTWAWATDAEGKQVSEPKQYKPEQIAQAAQKQFMSRVQAFHPQMMQAEDQFTRGLQQKDRISNRELDQRAQQHAETLAVTKQHYENLDSNTRMHYENEAKKLGVATGLQAYQLTRLKQADADAATAQKLGTELQGLQTVLGTLDPRKDAAQIRAVNAAAQGLMSRLEVLNPKVGFGTGTGGAGRGETWEQVTEDNGVKTTRKGVGAPPSAGGVSALIAGAPGIKPPPAKERPPKGGMQPSNTDAMPVLDLRGAQVMEAGRDMWGNPKRIVTLRDGRRIMGTDDELLAELGTHPATIESK